MSTKKGVVQRVAEAIAAPAESAPAGPEMSRLEVVERAGRALKFLAPLQALCTELGRVDEMDRMVANAEVRVAQAEEAHAAALARHGDEMRIAEARAAKQCEEHAEDLRRMTLTAEVAVADMDKRAHGLMASAEKSAAEMVGKAQSAVAALDAQSAALRAQVERLESDVQTKAAEVAASEAKLAKVRKAASALLEG